MKNKSRVPSRRLVGFFLVSLFMISMLGSISTTDVRGNEGSSRTVVLELFTSTWCGSCPYADEAADTLSIEFGPERFSVLQYHLNYPLDPMATDETTERGNDYDWNTPGLPAAWFDGVGEVTRVDDIELFHSLYKDKIEERLGSQSPISISISMSESSGNVTVGASFEKAKNITPSEPIHSRYVLYENSVSHSVQDFNYVVRDMEERPFDYDGLPYSEDVTFKLESGWESSNIGVVVFVQVGDIGEVLQSANAVLGPKPTVTMTTQLDGKQISEVTTIEGTASVDTQRVEVRIDGRLYDTADGTTSWSFDIDPGQMSAGKHTLSVRAYSESLVYSDLVDAEFEVKSDLILYIIIALAVIILVGLAAAFGIRSKRAKDKE